MISIVICSVDDAKFSAVRENLAQRLGGEPHEFVRISDARSLAEGYNRGIAQSKGEFVLICHDDIEILADDFRERLMFRLERFDLLGIAGSTRFVGPKWVAAGPPHIFGQVAHLSRTEKCYDVYVWGAPAPCIGGMKVMDGLLLAGHRRVFEAVPFDAATFGGFHMYDMDFTFRAAAAGLKLAACLDLMIIHASTGIFEAQWRQEAEKLAAKHHANFEPLQPHAWQPLLVRVPRKEQLPEILRSPHWSNWRKYAT